MIINKRITSICFSLIIAIAMIIPCFAEASYKGSGLDKGVTFILPNQWEEVAEEDKEKDL